MHLETFNFPGFSKGLRDKLNQNCKELSADPKQVI